MLQYTPVSKMSGIYEEQNPNLRIDPYMEHISIDLVTILL